jgi:trimeric autotransporter adhesin
VNALEVLGLLFRSQEEDTMKTYQSLKNFTLLALMLAAAVASRLTNLHAQGTAFTYQGSLTQSGVPVTRSQDFEFRLFSAPTAGTQEGPAMIVNDLAVSNGLFTVLLDFGGAALSGADRWLEIATRPGTNTGPHTTLAPRQLITSAPYAVRAGNLTGILPLAQLPTAVVTNNGTGLSLTGSFTGNGSGLTNLSLTGLNSTGPNVVRSIETPGTEQLYLHAGKNLDFETVNDVTFWAGHNFIAVVDNDSSFLGKHNVNFTVNNNLTTTVHEHVNSTVDKSVTSFIGQNLAVSVGGPLNLSVGGNTIVDLGNNLDATVDGGASIAVSEGLNVEANDNLALAANKLTVLAPGGVSISTAGTGARLQLGDTNTANSQGMMRFASRSGTGPASRYWDIGVPEGDQNVAGKFYSFVIDDPQLGPDPELIVRWDTGRVGIGTVNPLSSLHAVADISNGVQGNTSDPDASGVYGENLSGAGYGVAGRAAGSGNAIYGENTSGLGFAGYFVGDVHVTGTITPPSDRNVKRDFAQVDSREVLEKVAALPIHTWAYTNDVRAARHLGPVSQDFRAAFGLGADDKSIATVDADGVALAAIQGLNEKVKEQAAELIELKTRLAVLERLLTKNQKDAK